MPFTCFPEKGKDLSAAIDGETKDDVQRLLLGLLLVSRLCVLLYCPYCIEIHNFEPNSRT